MRFLLGQLVLHVLRTDGKLRKWYKGIKQRRGSKIARVAVMRRLAVIMWHMLSKQEPYQPGGMPAGTRRRRGAEDPQQACEVPARREVLALPVGAAATAAAEVRVPLL